jgi:rubrerythrin
MNYRKPTAKEKEKLEKSREKMTQGIEGEKDIFSKMMPTMAKSARDDMKAARAMRESVPASAREGEAYEYAGYKSGGKVSSASKRADGCAIRGKTKA